MELALAVALCLASGFALVSATAPRRAWGALDFLSRGSLAIGFGVGLFSIVFFLDRIARISNPFAPDLAIFGVLVVLLVIRRRKPQPIPVSNPPSEVVPAWLRRALKITFAIAVCAALYAAIMRALAYPQGNGWDAFAIWNLRARFLFLGGARWRDGFTPLLPGSHPDYPLLLPAAIAHFWSYLGRDSAVIPAVLGIAFLVGTVGLLFSALRTLRGQTPAIFGAITLLATPAFVEQGTSQYADVPLSFFYLSTIALLSLYDESERFAPKGSAGLLVLAGLSAGFAAWTKNEGLLFVCALLLANIFWLLIKSESKPSGSVLAQNVWLWAGCLPLFLLVICYKHWIAGPGDLFSSNTSMLARLVQPARYWAVVKWFAKDFLRFGDWLALPGTLVLVLFYLLLSKRDARRWKLGYGTSTTTLVLTLAGYFFVYLITPYDIYWHLRFSSERLFLQLWPSTIFLFFGNIPWNLASTKASQNESGCTQPGLAHET
jgi:hypothetical protein